MTHAFPSVRSFDLPLLYCGAARYQAWLRVTAGVIAVPQAEDSLAALRAAVAGLDNFALTALHNLTVAGGSLVLALAVAEGRVDAATAWSLSRLDEDWQAGIWGEDPEAARRAAALPAEIAATARFPARSSSAERRVGKGCVRRV